MVEFKMDPPNGWYPVGQWWLKKVDANAERIRRERANPAREYRVVRYGPQTGTPQND